MEDCGGFPGYEEILDALADRTRPDHAEYSAWAAEMAGTDGPFDPDSLSIADVNRDIASRFAAMAAAPPE